MLVHYRGLIKSEIMLSEAWCTYSTNMHCAFRKKRLLLGKSYRNFTQHFKDTIQMLTLELIIGCQYSVLAHTWALRRLQEEQSLGFQGRWLYWLLLYWSRIVSIGRIGGCWRGCWQYWGVLGQTSHIRAYLCVPDWCHTGHRLYKHIQRILKEMWIDLFVNFFQHL